MEQPHSLVTEFQGWKSIAGPFNGGSRVLVNGELTLKEVRIGVLAVSILLAAVVYFLFSNLFGMMFQFLMQRWTAEIAAPAPEKKTEKKK